MAVVSTAVSSRAVMKSPVVQANARLRAALCVFVAPDPPPKSPVPKPDNDPEIPPAQDPPPHEPPQHDPPTEPPDVHDPEPHKIDDPPAPGAPPEIIA